MKIKFITIVLLLYSSIAMTSIEDELRRLEKINEVNLDESSQLIHTLESKLTEFKDDNQRARFYIQKAYGLALKSENKKSRDSLNKLFALKNLEPRHTLSAYHLLSQIDMNGGNYNYAFEHLFSYLELLPKIKNEKDKLSVFHSAANVFLQIEAYDDALSYAQRLMEVAKKTKNEVDKCYAAALIGEISIAKGDLDDGLKELDIAEPICKLNNLNIVTVNVLKNRGIYFFNTQQFEKSKDIFLEALDISENHPYKIDVVHIYSYLAKLYLEQNKLLKASELAQKILKNSKNQVFIKRQKDAYQVLAQVSKKNNDYQTAYSYLEKSKQLDDLIRKDLADKNLVYQKVKYATADQEAQIQILDQKNQLLELNQQVELQSKRNLQLIAIIVFFALALTAAGLWRVKRQKERYRTLSEHDGLTGIYNRTHVLNVAQRSFIDNYNSDKDYSMINFDLDYFKAINDQYGHPFGDWLLGKVVNVCKQLIRSDDIFGRVGGEEFVIFLPNTSSDNAHQLAQRCRQALAQIKHSQVADEFSVTASFGVVTKRDDKQSFESFMKLADDSMYKAKRLGRNRVYVHQY